MATPEMIARANKFEKEYSHKERGMKAHRASLVRKGGFKNEKDYFENVNPFTGKRRSISKALAKAKK